MVVVQVTAQLVFPCLQGNLQGISINSDKNLALYPCCTLQILASYQNPQIRNREKQGI